MKYFLSLFLCSWLACFSQAQSFEVVRGQGTYKGEIGKSIEVPIRVKNLTNRPIQIVVKRIDQVIGTSQSSYFCWGDDCFDAEVEQLPLSQRVEADETSSKFVSVLETGLVEGISTVKYLIYNRDIPADVVEYEVNYTVEENLGNNVIFSSAQIKINEVYPNPANEYAIFDYNLLDEDVDAKIIMHNVLGSIVGEYELSFLETKLKVITENMNPGVYFYTLNLDNEGIMTKKMIIRR
ncbi:MAG: T9SS type A sorting domain-containing protein [Bacteroidota bacterium]